MQVAGNILLLAFDQIKGGPSLGEVFLLEQAVTAYGTDSQLERKLRFMRQYFFRTTTFTDRVTGNTRMHLAIDIDEELPAAVAALHAVTKDQAHQQRVYDIMSQTPLGEDIVGPLIALTAERDAMIDMSSAMARIAVSRALN